MRWIAGFLLPLVVIASGIGVVNASGYAASRHALEAHWDRMTSDGVPPASLAYLRGQLALIDRQERPVLPVALFSGAVMGDPLVDLEVQTDRVWREQVATARDGAAAALSDLLVDDTYSFTVYEEGQNRLASATTPRQLAALRADWRARSKLALEARARLASVAGGLTGSAPADVSTLATSIHSLTDTLAAAKIATDPGPATINDVAAYLWLPVTEQVTRHDQLVGELKAAESALQERNGVHDDAVRLDGQAHSLLDTLQAEGVAPGDMDTTLGSADQALAAARTTPDLVAARTSLQTVVNRLSERLQQPLYIPSTYTACIPGAPAALIVVHIVPEVLVAYKDGCPWLQTLITTGRPELRTDLGTFHIFAKYSPYQFISPWPPGNPFHYNSAWTKMAMEFVGDGTFLHDSDWEPAWAFGPGSENGPYASHGCVHVPDGAMASIFNWAPIGTEVITQQD